MVLFPDLRQKFARKNNLQTGWINLVMLSMNKFIIVNFLPIKGKCYCTIKTDRLFKFSYQLISDGQ